MSTFVPSPAQQTYYDWLTGDKGSAIIRAVAGSGKTTTIVNGIPLLPPWVSVQLFSFNTEIAKEMKSRLEFMREDLEWEPNHYAGVRASTFHSIGFGAVRKHLGSKLGKTDGNKSRTLIRAWLGERDQELYGPFIAKLVGYAKGQGIGALTPDTLDAWWDLIRHHDLALDSEEADEEQAVALARELLKRSNDAAKTQGLIDFDDQLYLPLLWRCRLFQNDYVFIDEAQDTNPARRALAKLALKPGGRLIAVGDPRQAIYGFTGASADAMDLIKREFNCVELPLTVSYRCAKSVVELAKTLVPYLEAAPGAAEGQVTELPAKDALKLLDAHDAVLCRNTAPLVAFAFHLIAQGRGCVILGRDIGAGLIDLIKKQRAAGIDRLVEKLEAFREREVAKFMAKGEEQKAEAVTDRMACIKAVIDNLTEANRTIPALIAMIDGMFSDTNGVLTLATIHKAKGKEWKRVGILRADLMPSKWARQDWQREQEYNLMYVAYTRAMEHLIFITGDVK